MENMSDGEMWGVFFITLFWFTGLWRITRELSVIIRSGLIERVKEQNHMKSVYFAAWSARITGLLTVIFISIFMYYDIPLSKFCWIFVIILSYYTIIIAGEGRNIIGDYIPLWLMPGHSNLYEGFGESLNRLPETPDEKARQLFKEGQEAENNLDFVSAIAKYEKILTIDPEYVRCLTAKGILHCKRHDLPEGRNLFLAAANICPTSAFVLHLLARVEKQMGLISDSQRHEEMAKHNLMVERSKEIFENQFRKGRE